MNAVLPDQEMPITTVTEIDTYRRLVDHSICFSKIPNELSEEVFLERLLTCDGKAPFGHCGVVSLAVKHTYLRNLNGYDDWVFEGMVYVTFASRDVASFF